MIDIHTHILPGMDDGAGDPAQALAMLAIQKECGVNRLFLTPHYYPQRRSAEEFLERRAESWARLQEAAGNDTQLQMRLGAEVHYCPQILDLDLRQLTLGGSDYLLLELPGRTYPPFIEQVTEEVLERGIVPVLAHVERFSYFRREPALLRRLIDMGALGQVSADALYRIGDRGFARACLDHELAQLAASDAHNTTDRKPGLEAVSKLPEQLRSRMAEAAAAVWENGTPPFVWTTELKKTFRGYR